MPLHSIKELQNPGGLSDIIKELQGLTTSLVTGAAANTKMDLPAIRQEDTILAAIRYTNTWSPPTNVASTLSIDSVRASGTLTISGNPLDNETFVVNDVTYTFKNTPTQMTHVKITPGQNNTMAAAVASAVNSYERRRLPGGNYNTPAVEATVSGNVVTFRATVDGPGNGPVVTSSNGTRLAVSNADPAAVTVTAAGVQSADTVTVNGVTFTASATPTGDLQFLTITGNNTNQAAEIARVINAYDNKYGTLDVSATSSGAVTTIRPRSAKKGNIITLTESATNVTVSGSGYLSGGTNTGGIRSTSDLSNSTIMVIWFNKN